MKVRVWIWKHLALKSLILFRANSATGFRSLICLSSNLSVFFHQHWIAFSTRKSYNLFTLSQFNYQKYQWRSPRCWNYYCENHCLIKASWCVFKWKHSYEFGPVFEMVLELGYKAAFPTIYLLLSAGLTVGVSTATCEASFSSVVRTLTPYRRCMTHDHTGA